MASEALAGIQQSHWDQAFRSDAAKNPIAGKLFWTRVVQYKFLRMRPGCIRSSEGELYHGGNQKDKYWSYI